MRSFRFFWFLVFSFWFLVGLKTKAQSDSVSSVFTLEEAVKSALENGFDIQVAQLQAAQAANSANAGNAGLLPTITAQGGVNYGINNTELEFAGDIPPNEVNGAQSLAYNASIGANYTLFDGLGIFRSFEVLKLNAANANVQSRAQIEGLLTQVVQSYTATYLSEENLEIAKQTLTISADRLQRAKSKFELGGSSKLDYLNAQVDYNADSSTYINAKLQLAQNKRQLNYLMGQSVSRDIGNTRFPAMSAEMDKSSLWGAAQTDAAAIASAEYANQVAVMNRKLANSGFFPIVTINGSYGFSESQNDAGIVLKNRQIGFSAGANVSVPIFNGFRNQTNLSNQKIAEEISEENLSKAKANLAVQFENAWQNYQAQKTLWLLEESNIETAQSNFDRTKLRWQQGQVNNVQYREAQLNLVRSNYRLLSAKVQSKLAEVELQRLSGKLVQ